MAGEFNEAQYSDKKALADRGLGIKEVATPDGGDTLISTPPTGRPPVGPQVPTAQPAAGPTEEFLEPGDEHHQLMHLLSENDSALTEVQQLLNLPGAGQWVQFLNDLATEATHKSGLALNQGTPNWNLE